MKDNEFVQNAYNQIAHHYNKGRDQFKNDRYLNQFVNLLNQGSTVLDIGCGSGRPIDRFLVDHGLKVVGFDISEEQIALAKKNVPEGHFEVKDMATLKADDYFVDGVISFYALFHTPREQHHEILKKINTFLSDNGVALITMGASEWEGVEEFHGTEMFWSHFGPKENRALFEDADFRVLIDEIDISGGERHQILLGRKRNGK